ncbi:unnamed protein product, partial [Mesorhabditis spiculigera]
MQRRAFTNGEGLIHHRHSLSFSATRNGTVTHRQRIELNIPCSSEPSEYPWGNATCQILWRSEHSQESMRLIWDDAAYGQFGSGERLVGDLRMVQVDFTAHEHQKDFSSYDELTISFTFKRSLNKTVYLFFFPSILFIGISWLSFLLGPMAITRAILVMSSFILLYLHYYFNMAGLPETSGITSIDIWKLFSLLFVFGVLVELVSVSCMASVGRSRSIQACCRSKKKKGKYEMEPLYEELNDLRQRKTRRTCRFIHLTCLSDSEQMTQKVNAVWKCDDCRPESKTPTFADLGARSSFFTLCHTPKRWAPSSPEPLRRALPKVEQLDDDPPATTTTSSDRFVTCTFCLDDIDSGHKFVTNCRHEFHHQCAEPWFIRASTCPNCRQKVKYVDLLTWDPFEDGARALEKGSPHPIADVRDLRRERRRRGRGREGVPAPCARCGHELDEDLEEAAVCLCCEALFHHQCLSDSEKAQLDGATLNRCNDCEQHEDE